MIKKLGMLLTPLVFAGFILPDDSCHNASPVSKQVDGPYVLYHNDQVIIHSIVEEDKLPSLHTDSTNISNKENVLLKVSTDQAGQFFDVHLQKNLEPQQSEYAQPSKMFILSDIEGNFAGFRKLLQAGSVIDSAFNWTFGDGHLVLIGDFMDRGTQVPEVLWLIYSLEEKARAAGGYVHYILGNHEIMNLSGDLRYVQPKYFQSAALIKTGYTSLYGEQSELGRWMRTKNVVERIGNILFMHGGISANVNRMNMQAPLINQLTRPYYADSLYKYPDPRCDTLMGDTGPFWFRGYYLNKTGHEPNMVDSTLSIYRVSHIATGHTIIADTVSVSYNEKVFNTDVHHAGGHSEALLVMDRKYYRLLPDGQKILIAADR